MANSQKIKKHEKYKRIHHLVNKLKESEVCNIINCQRAGVARSLRLRSGSIIVQREVLLESEKFSIESDRAVKVWIESLRLRCFGLSREPRTSRSHVIRSLQAGLRFEVHVCAARPRFSCEGWFPVSRYFYVRTCVKFTIGNKIEAMHERSLDSVKVEPRSTSRLSSAIFILPLFYLRDLNLRALMFIHFICNVIHAFDLYTQPCGRKFAECVNAEGINVINYLKYNKVLNVITFCPKCNNVLS